MICGAILAAHFETVLKVQDECSLLLAYSKSTGTGKTTSLRIALSLFGAAGVHFKGGKSTLSSILSRASVTTLPTGVDDINSAAHVEGLTVQFFNGAGHSTVSTGSMVPRTSILMTANKAFAESSRNAVRLIHVPFLSVEGTETTQRRRQEDQLKQACQSASSSVGLLISIGRAIGSSAMEQRIETKFLPLVQRELPDLHYRMHKSYALLLAVNEQVCRVVPSGVVCMREVVEYFQQLWAPEVSRLLKPGSSILEDLLGRILADTSDLPIYEINRFLRPAVESKSKGAAGSLAIYLPLLRVHCEVDERKLRDAIKAAGGNLKASLPFLREDSTAETLRPAENGKQRKCCTIPHSALSGNILEALIKRVSHEEHDDTDITSISSPEQSTRLSFNDMSTDLNEPSTHLSFNDMSTDLSIEQSTKLDCSSLNRPAYSTASPAPVKPLVVYSSSSEEEEDEEYDGFPRTSIPTDLVSVSQNSQAIIRPVPLVSLTSDPKTVCPKDTCIVQRETKRTWWVACTKCEQWYHQRCVKLNKQKAEAEDFYCFRCA